MIEQLKNDIQYLGEKQQRKSFSTLYMNILITYFLSMKYYCDIGKYSYEDVISEEELYEINFDIKRVKRFIHPPFLIHRLLKDYIHISVKDLLVDFLSHLEKRITFHEKEDALYIGIIGNMYSFYDDTGNSTYMILDDMDEEIFQSFQVFDNILGVHNKYLKEMEILPSNYHYLYIYDDTPKYRFLHHNNVYNRIEAYIKDIEHIILFTNFSKIGNFREGRMIAKYIQTIILQENKAIMMFSSYANQNISIINYDNEKIPSFDRLKEIIQNNRRIKDILIKISNEDLKKNNYRIGFHLYQLEENNNIMDINKIVDENTHFLEELNYINDRVENEINKLLNR